MRGALGFAALAALFTGTGCRNSCQQICSRMADYATEDCGMSVSDGEIDACIQRMGDAPDRDDKKACRDFGDAEAIRTQWTCEEVARYWSSDAA